MKKLNVYSFDYNVGYGGGLMLIAAADCDAAMEKAATVSTGFGRWDYDGQVKGLTFDSETGEPQVLVSQSYAE